MAAGAERLRWSTVEANSDSVPEAMLQLSKTRTRAGTASTDQAQANAATVTIPALLPCIPWKSSVQFG